MNLTRLFILFGCCLYMGLGIAPVSLAEVQEENPAELSRIDASEILEAEPIDQYPAVAESVSNTASGIYTPLTPETLPPGEPYPIVIPVSSVHSDTFVPTTGTACLQYPFLPYVLSAYIPVKDRTELDLSLLLNEPPGIGAGLSWGAWEELMLASQMTVQSSSYTAGINLRYAFRKENIQGNQTSFGSYARLEICEFQNLG